MTVLAPPLSSIQTGGYAPAADDPTGKTLVIGLGNPIVSDDSVGLRVAEVLRERLTGRDDVVVETDCWGGLRLMEQMIGYRHAIVVDAATTGRPPGEVRVGNCVGWATRRSTSAHDVDLATALRFGRGAGAALPADEDVLLVAVEAEDVINFGDACTPAVARAIPHAVREVMGLLGVNQRRAER